MNTILKGKTILIAGAGGIGNGLAIRYAQEGANIVLGDLDITVAQKAVAEITDKGGLATAIYLDGADEASACAAATRCIETYGRLDGLHANFAYMADGRPDIGILELPMDVFDETLRVNARGFYLCTKAVLPLMVQQGGGSIIYTSSAAAHAGSPAQVAYSMSKAAGQALMRHVAKRFGDAGIRANTLAPALTLHAGLAGVIPAEMIEMARSVAAIKSRVGCPDDLAAMGALLLSDLGSYVTGQVISIDGGTTMRP